jgi:diketogulonate reductase-like aldo/keto reductase
LRIPQQRNEASRGERTFGRSRAGLGDDHHLLPSPPDDRDHQSPARGELLDDPTIGAIAERHEVTPAQAILRWHLQLGNIVFPKSVTPARIRENFDLFDFELSPGEMDRVARLDRGERIGPDPATFG